MSILDASNELLPTILGIKTLSIYHWNQCKQLDKKKRYVKFYPFNDLSKPSSLDKVYFSVEMTFFANIGNLEECFAHPLKPIDCSEYFG